ncbi:hypothetical protein [Plantactinospora sp. KLBMP9567]|uniref:hypothetical protein n=1 Tax=Plantactinospora sp. KLBMP9567 TaxID=3085900 RepID=UPI0029819E86|nr:hypothetical protein [Plantactinospora sp. KLBMP9567]MDW5327509.1 hypothetical protein [Plantactinospora sp. KLBMP9567]
MNSLDSRLASGLRDLVDGEPLSAAPTEQILRRGVWARRRRAVAVVGASCAVLTVGVVATTVITQSTAAPDRPAVVAEAPSPRLELVAAIAASENVSYRVKATSTYNKSYGGTRTPDSSYTSEGAFDPATTSGYSRFDGEERQRLVAGVLYTHVAGGQFVREPGRAERLAYDPHVLDGALSGSVDRELLFGVLRQADAKIIKKGDRAYHFDATTKSDGGPGPATVRFVGDVTVDADGRVATVRYDWRMTGRTTAKPPTTFAREVRAVMEFSGYGAPVTVEPPTNVVVAG